MHDLQNKGKKLTKQSECSQAWIKWCPELQRIIGKS